MILRISILLLGLFVMFSFKSETRLQDVSEMDMVIKDTVKKSEKPDAEIGAKLVDFNVVDSKDALLFRDQIVDKKLPFILVLFNPSCGHCKETMMEFVKRKEEFKHIKMMFVCGNNFVGELKAFVEETGCKDIANFVVAADNSEATKLLFEYKGIPQLMIYNQHQILQKTYYKEISIDSVLNQLSLLNVKKKK